MLQYINRLRGGFNLLLLSGLHPLIIVYYINEKGPTGTPSACVTRKVTNPEKRQNKGTKSLGE